jgi:threonine/homoserine/homoserine lactone efflux protein
MELPALALFAAALFVNSSTPGPSIAALVARVVTKGPKDVLPFLAAMWVGEALWLLAAVLGLSVIAQSFHVVFVAIKYCGVAYLIYLAWRMWTAPGAGEKREGAPKGTPAQMFLAGFAITMGNPKIMVFYLALLPAIIDLRAIEPSSFALLIATTVAVLMSVDLAWVGLASGARRMLKSQRAMRIANRCGAVAMGGAAAAIAAR